MSDLLRTIDGALIFAGWLALGIVFLLRRRGAAGPTRRRNTASLFGMLLQGIGFGFAWNLRRAASTAAGDRTLLAQGLLTLAIAGLVSASVWMVGAAVRVLGKQWSLTARVVEGHELITEGPYRIVRHPIYTGMLGLLVATGLGFSTWPALGAGILVYALGTWIRVEAEERLLRTLFGEAYDQYARRVPAIIPLPRGR